MQSSDVIAAVKTVVQNNIGKIERVINDLTGGWEGWLQVEATLALMDMAGAGSKGSREDHYPVPNAAQRTDIALLPAKGTKIYVELKVQNAPNDDIIDRFVSDVAKIRSLDPITRRDFVIVAVAFMKTFDVANLRATLLRLPSGTSQVWQWNGATWDNTTDAPAVTVSGRDTLVTFKLR